MKRVIHILELSVAILALGIAAILMWSVASPITIHISNAFAGTVSSLTPDQQQITATLTAFVAQEQEVDIATPDASTTIAEDYGSYVTPKLLSEWEANPRSAPGRTAQSPWADHVIIHSIVPTSDGFTAYATLVFENAQTAARGGFDSEDPLLVTFSVHDRQWVISGYADEADSGN